MRRLVPAILVLCVAACSSGPPPSPPDIGSFGDFKAPSTLPHYLACPQNYCAAKPNEITPLERVTAAHMRDLVRHALDAEPRTTLVSSANEGLRLVYRQDPGFLSSGGNIVVEIVDADEGVSGLVLYGDGDSVAGDARRVRQWIVDIYAAITEDLNNHGGSG